MQAQLQSQTSRDFASTKMQTRQATTTARESNSSDNALSSMSENAFAATLPARSLQQQQQQQQLATSGYKLAPPSATAATAKIRPTAATMMKSAPSLSATMTLPSRSAVAKKQVTRSLSPSASATSAANATTTSAACPSSYLRSSFKIGSTHGRMNFDDDERVFHRSDAPQKARDARTYISTFLRSHTLQRSDLPWDSSTISGPYINGSKHCSWTTSAEKFDNRYYHSLTTTALISAAKWRLDTIRAGGDPDADPRAIQPRWNVSTAITDANGKLPTLTPLPGRKLAQPPENHRSLIEAQTALMRYIRGSKQWHSQQQQREEEIKRRWREYERSESVFGPPVGIHSRVGGGGENTVLSAERKKEIAEAVEREYDSTSLVAFISECERDPVAVERRLLSQQIIAEAKMDPSLAPIVVTDRNWREADVPPSVHHIHRSHSHTHIHSDDEQLPYSSSLPPAWYRSQVRAKKEAKVREVGVYAKYRHPGTYEFITAADEEEEERDRRGEQESKDSSGSVGSNGVSSGKYRWSCCLHPLRDARGCVAYAIDSGKQRVIVGRSDDRRSIAGMGFSGPSTQETIRAAAELDERSHLRETATAAAIATAVQHTVPTIGGTATVAGMSNGIGLSGPGVAIVKRFEHSGKYEKHAYSGDELWSCCGAYEKDAIGCISKIVTQEHRWQLSSS